MCGRYLVITEGEIIEMRAILDELGKRFGGIDELPSFGLPAQQPSGFSSGLSSQRASGVPSQLSFLPDTVQSAASGSGEVFPGAFTPVLVLDDDTAILRPMRWGFSRWDGKGVVINARSETVSDKPMFRRALSSGRCIIPSRGFYEWRHGADPAAAAPKAKAEKYRILHKDSPLFFMTGIYQIKDGIEEFVILTMPAMEQMKVIHDRMPVFAVNTQIIDWLEDPQSLDTLVSNRSAQLSLELLRV